MNNTASWPQPQEIVGKPMEEIITNNNNNNSTTKPQPSTSLERKVRPQKEQAVNCPRCNSTNTKFCYYNNYSLTQPRYFCKTCRRYWTEGGSLRNIPVGGGSRKNKRPASSAFPSPNNNSSSKMIKLPDLVPPQLITQNPNPSSHKIIHHHDQHQQQGQDLNLGFPSTLSEFMHPSNTSALELLTGLTNSSSRGLMAPFMPMHLHQDPHSGFPSGFSLHGHADHLKQPALHFSLDGLAADASGCLQDSGIGTGRILFPFEDLKSTITTASATTPTTTTTAGDHQHHHNSADQQITRDQQGDSTGYWTGILGGAGSW